MRHWILAAVLLFVSLDVGALEQGQVNDLPGNLSGQWVLYLVRSGEQFDPARVTLAQNGNDITGNLNELKLSGTIHGNIMDLTARRPDGNELRFKINVSGAELTGTMKRGPAETSLTMHRIAGPSSSLQRRTFTPSKYSRVFTGTPAPVLRINSGDTVKTTTIDAGGNDEKGVSRSLGGNPQTGPFYVEGAIPGDTLAITINRLRLNRDSAASTSSIMPIALTADYYRNAKIGDAPDGNWKLDRASGTASLAKSHATAEEFQNWVEAGGGLRGRGCWKQRKF